MIDIVPNKSFPIVGWMVELDSGVTKENISKMMDMINVDSEIMSFSASANNSSIYGFITAEAYEKIDYDEEYLQKFLTPILSDWTNESPDKTYTLPNGLQMYIDCDCETTIIQPA